MPTWELFVIVGILFCLAEVFVPGFVLFPIGIACGITALFVPFIPSLAGDLALLAVVLTVVFAVSPKILKRSSRKRISHASGVDALIGKTAVVTQRFSTTDKTGQIKVYGDVLSATLDVGQNINVGEFVVIERIDGNRATVSPLKKD